MTRSARSGSPIRFGAMVLLMSIAASGSVALAASAPPRAITYVGRAMGTYTHVTIVTADSAATAAPAQRAQAEFQRVDSLMSNWTPTSEVARINREASHGPTRIQAEVSTVIEKALEVGRASDGAFDITVEPLVRVWGFLGGKPHLPDSAAAAEAARHVGIRHLNFDAAARTIAWTDPGVRVDLGGIAKGYSVDRATDALRAAGIGGCLVDISGNMFAVGHPPEAAGWRIGIRDPRDRIAWFARLQLSDAAISTSGKYEQFVAANGRTYGHIMDPRLGVPAEGLIAVTVVARTAMDADAWSTALFVLGPVEAMRIARERDDLAAILVIPGDDGLDTVWVEKTLRGRFTFEPRAERYFRLRFF